VAPTDASGSQASGVVAGPRGSRPRLHPRPARTLVCGRPNQHPQTSMSPRFLQFVGCRGRPSHSPSGWEYTSSTEQVRASNASILSPGTFRPPFPSRSRTDHLLGVASRVPHRVVARLRALAAGPGSAPGRRRRQEPNPRDNAVIRSCSLHVFTQAFSRSGEARCDCRTPCRSRVGPPHAPAPRCY
jgi:hypothetical protein